MIGRGIFTNNILTYRLKRGMSQKHLAGLLGMKDQSQICHWEKGTKIPSTPKSIDIANALCTSVDELFSDYRITSKENINIRKEILEN